MNPLLAPALGYGGLALVLVASLWLLHAARHARPPAASRPAVDHRHVTPLHLYDWATDEGAT